MTKDKSIRIKNIYYMLSYAFQTLKESVLDEVAIEEFDTIHNLFAAILSKGISVQLKRGLYKAYLIFNNRHDTSEFDSMGRYSFSEK